MWIFVGMFMLIIALFVLAYAYKTIKAFYLDGLFKFVLCIFGILIVIGAAASSKNEGINGLIEFFLLSGIVVCIAGIILRIFAHICIWVGEKRQ